MQVNNVSLVGLVTMSARFSRSNALRAAMASLSDEYVFSLCYNIFASEEWQPATSRGISLLKLLEWEGNGLTLFSKGFVPVIKSVSHLPIRSVRFVQVEPRVRVTKQIESAMGKDGSVHCKFFQE